MGEGQECGSHASLVVSTIFDVMDSTIPVPIASASLKIQFQDCTSLQGAIFEGVVPRQ